MLDIFEPVVATQEWRPPFGLMVDPRHDPDLIVHEPPAKFLGPPPLNPGYEYGPCGDIIPPAVELVGTMPVDFGGSGP